MSPLRSSHAAVPSVNAGDADPARITAEAIDALVQANEPPAVFRHGGHLIRIETGDHGEPVMLDVTCDRLVEWLARALQW